MKKKKKAKWGWGDVDCLVEEEHRLWMRSFSNLEIEILACGAALEPWCSKCFIWSYTHTCSKEIFFPNSKSWVWRSQNSTALDAYI